MEKSGQAGLNTMGEPERQAVTGNAERGARFP
jgi:hypothetical protein